MGYGNNTIPPGKEGMFTVMYPLPLYHETPMTENDIERIKAGSKQIVVAGIIKYIDEYGPRETHFCYSFQGRDTSLEGAIWTDCEGHNGIVSPK